MSAVTDFLMDHSIAVFGVTETRLLPSFQSSFIDVPGYVLLRHDTDGHINKHGVCVFIRQNLKHDQVSRPLPNTLLFRLTDFDVFILIVYRPPSSDICANENLISVIESVCSSHEVIILGDFNLPSLTWTLPRHDDARISATDSSFLDCFDSLGLSQWVCEPTFPRSGNILDLLLTTEPDRVGSIKVLPPLPRCDHCPYIADYVFQSEPRCVNMVKQVSDSFRLWQKGKYSQMNHVLGGIDWDFEFAHLNCASSFLRLCQILHPLIDEFVPLKTHKDPRPPWPVRPPPSLLRRRSVLWKQFKEVRAVSGRRSIASQRALSSFLSVNSDIHNFHVRSQAEYENSLSLRLKENPKLLHSYVRHRKVGRTTVGPLRLPSDKLSDNPAEMVEMFAEAFASVYLTANLPHPAPFQHCFGRLSCISVCQEEVERLLNDLDSFSAMGPDNLHPHVLKSCSSILSYPLTLIFQKSVNEGCIPPEWKNSRIVPIYKKGCRYSPLNYRPISLTSVCCKSLERIIARQLNAYLTEHDVLCPHQFGFRSGRTTMDQLLLTYDDVSVAVDDGVVTDMVLFDFSKAFDVVSHEILLAKLYHVGIRGNLHKWLADFLLNRKMVVEVSGVSSSPRRVLSGVPQGSVLGPILFLIFINNIASSLSCKHKIFADDLKIYSSIAVKTPSEYVDASGKFQADIDCLHATGVSWGLSMNSAKCAVLRFQRGSVNIPPPSYRLSGDLLPTPSNHRDLGVVVDVSLKFHEHVRETARKAGGLATNLLKSTVCRSPEFMLTLFTSHVRPIIDYCSSVWNMGYICDIRLLERIQRRWTKQVTGLGDMDYGQRLRVLNLFSIQGRLLRADLIQYWKILSGRSCIPPEALFRLAGDRNTRGHPLKLYVPRCRTDLRQRFFSVRCIPQWNALPSDIVASPSVDCFKKALTVFLGEKLFEYVD